MGLKTEHRLLEDSRAVLCSEGKESSIRSKQWCEHLCVPGLSAEGRNPVRPSVAPEKLLGYLEESMCEQTLQFKGKSGQGVRSSEGTEEGSHLSGVRAGG